MKGKIEEEEVKNHKFHFLKIKLKKKL